MNTKSSKKLEKSRGILAFAYNTAVTDYESIAHKTLTVASRRLGLPYTLITDKEFPCNIHNTRYDIDLEQFVQWRNQGRHAAYELSPYKETLVIDVDYLVLDNRLLDIFDLPWDYLLHRRSHALTVDWPATMGPHSLPYVWATVFSFRKTEKAQQFFDLVGKIQRNYSYYCALFNVQERNYRNDYAFAIADIVLNGYTVDLPSIPGSILAVDQSIESIDLQDTKLVIRDANRAYVAPRTNLHIMSKAYLQSANFAQLTNQLLNESA
jgi:hypothetical protein